MRFGPVHPDTGAYSEPAARATQNVRAGEVNSKMNDIDLNMRLNRLSRVFKTEVVLVDREAFH